MEEATSGGAESSGSAGDELERAKRSMEEDFDVLERLQACCQKAIEEDITEERDILSGAMLLAIEEGGSNFRSLRSPWLAAAGVDQRLLALAEEEARRQQATEEETRRTANRARKRPRSIYIGSGFVDPQAQAPAPISIANGRYSLRRRIYHQHTSSTTFVLMEDLNNGMPMVGKFYERGSKLGGAQSLGTLPNDPSSSLSKAVKDRRREIINHKQLNHCNIVGFKEVILLPAHVVIVMNYGNSGDIRLHNYVMSRKDVLSESEVRCFFQQLIYGVRYLHSKNICHRDLKGQNLLLKRPPFSTSFRDFCLMICDFAGSKVLMEEPSDPAMDYPEIRSYDGTAADVWSCGVVLHLMLFKQLHLTGYDALHGWIDSYVAGEKVSVNTLEEIMLIYDLKILEGPYALPERGREISLLCKDLLFKLMATREEERITIDEILAHPWFVAEDYNHDDGDDNEERPVEQSDEDIERLLQEARLAGSQDDAVLRWIKGPHPRWINGSIMGPHPSGFAF